MSLHHSPTGSVTTHTGMETTDVSAPAPSASAPPPRQAVSGAGAQAPAPAAPQALTDASSRLSAAQTRAMQALLAGKSFTEAAQEAGVARSTLYRWQTCDARFIAAFNAWQRQALSSARSRLLALSDKAVSAVGAYLFAGDYRAPFTLLQRLGALEPVQPGSDDPEVIEKELAQAGTPSGASPAPSEASNS